MASRIHQNHKIQESSFSEYTLAADAIYNDRPSDVKSILDRAKWLKRVGRNRREPTLLHLAVWEGRYNIVRILLGRGFDVNAQDSSYRIPLHYSLERGDDRTSKLLLESGSNVELCDFWARLPLHTERQHLESHFSMLKERGASIEARDFLRGYTLLHYATTYRRYYRNYLAMEILLIGGANIDAPTRDGNLAPLHMAAKRDDVWLSKFLLDYGADIEALDVNQATPLHLACTGVGLGDCVMLLLECGANVNARNRFNNTPLLLAIISGCYPIVEIILGHLPDVDDQRVLAISQAFIKGERFVKEHCRRRIHNALEEYGFTLHSLKPVDSLWVSLKRQKYQIALTLLTGTSIRVAQMEDNQKFLNQAIDDGQEKLVKLLMKSGVSVNAIGPHHRAPLSCEVDRGRQGIMLESDPENRCPLITAIDQNLPSMVKILLFNGLDPNKSWCYLGRGPLHYLIRKNTVTIDITSNSTRYINTNCQNELQMIEHLLEHGADVNSPDILGETPLDVTWKSPRLESHLRTYESKLLINGADINIGDSRERRFYHGSARRHMINLMSKLHIAGSYVSNYNISLVELFKMECLKAPSNRVPKDMSYYWLLLEHEKIWQAEVLKMKQHKLSDDVSLHRIFTAENPGYLYNQNLMEKLELVDFKQFPEYGDLLRGKLKRDRRRNKDLSQAREAFDLLVSHGTMEEKSNVHLPQLIPELVTMIISQLTELDQHQLILCGQSIKKQLLRKKEDN